MGVIQNAFNQMLTMGAVAGAAASNKYTGLQEDRRKIAKEENVLGEEKAKLDVDQKLLNVDEDTLKRDVSLNNKAIKERQYGKSVIEEQWRNRAEAGEPLSITGESFKAYANLDKEIKELRNQQSGFKERKAILEARGSEIGDKYSILSKKQDMLNERKEMIDEQFKKGLFAKGGKK